MSYGDVSRPDTLIANKLDRLRSLLRSMNNVAVAFSSGVDSTFLLGVAHDVLGDGVVALTARAPFFPRRETDEAVEFCRARGIRHEIVDFDGFSVPGFAENPPDRCYHCKKALFEKFIAVARGMGHRNIVEGSNLDDDNDYRPGRRAIKELGVTSPLHEAGFTKEEIRTLSREMGLPTWEKPSYACLVSRFPYGERITAAALRRVERAEKWLMDCGLGLKQLRVRSHGDIARIEVLACDMPQIISRASEISKALNEFGFSFVSLDLQGYRTGGGVADRAE